MTDLDRLASVAARARAEAEAAAGRAADLQTQAEADRQRAAAEREAHRRAWAQGIVDADDADIAAADAAIHEAGERFAAAADPAAAAGIRHDVLQIRLAVVAPAIGLEATEPSRIAPPRFCQALDQPPHTRFGESVMARRAGRDVFPSPARPEAAPTNGGRERRDGGVRILVADADRT